MESHKLVEIRHFYAQKYQGYLDYKEKVMSKVIPRKSSQFCSYLILYHAGFGDTAENQDYRQCWQPFLLNFTELVCVWRAEYKCYYNWALA